MNNEIELEDDYEQDELDILVNDELLPLLDDMSENVKDVVIRLTLLMFENDMIVLNDKNRELVQEAIN